MFKVKKIKLSLSACFERGLRVKENIELLDVTTARKTMYPGFSGVAYLKISILV